MIGAPSHQHSGPASPASHPEPSCSLLRQAAAPPGTFSLSPRDPAPALPPPLPQEGLSRSPGPWISSRAEVSHPALPLRAIAPGRMSPAAAPGPGKDRVRPPQGIPSRCPLLLCASPLLVQPCACSPQSSWWPALSRVQKARGKEQKDV